MEHWHTSNSAPHRSTTSGALSSRVLATSSGNVQSYVLDSNKGVENQNLFPPGAPSVRHEYRTDSLVSPSILKLGSNDQHAENIARLQARRQHSREKFGRRWRVDQERPYLQHSKYLQYRARQRCDTGPDGKPVWDDRIEDAFQNALVNIEPMGRKKKSQRGRPHGRNELISEWIAQETGEYRTRKQVSSHIQVLNTLLKGIPEWDALTTPDERAGSERPAHEYYSDSIEQMVRSQKSVVSHPYCNTSSHNMPTRSFTLPSNGCLTDNHCLMGLSFEMWVSLPKQMDQALHTYTRLHSSNSTLAPSPLEDIKNWRSSFPSLKPIIDNWSMVDRCDIILLEASFQLMSDFPPKFSKLGISLELDFLDPSDNNGDSLSSLTEWTSVTHLFQHGRLGKKLAHEDCHVSGVGKVKPFFESKWWASTFTQLTEKRKIAEDSENDAAIEAANETSHNFFRNLTVMQEISVETLEGGLSNGIYTDSMPRKRRMAILLWKFSQAQTGFVGTTKWQKLVPPPDRTTANSPTPLADMSLPPLAMDTMIDDDDLLGSANNFFSVTGQEYSLFGNNLDDELCQDGFMNYRPDTISGFEVLHSSFDMPASNNIDHNIQLSFDMEGRDLTQLQDHAAPSTTNFLELPLTIREGSQHASSLAMPSRHSSFSNAVSHQAHRPSAKFHMNTHQRLQAQLAIDNIQDPLVLEPRSAISLPTPTTQHSSIDAEDEALQVALLAASAMSDLDSQQRTQTTPLTATFLQPASASQPSYIPLSPNPFTSPPVSRPPLQAHHSFAGVNNEDLHSRQSSRGDFEKILANSQAFTEKGDMNFPFEVHGGGHIHGNGFPAVHEEISRPPSQPTLPAIAMASDVHDELHALHDGGMDSYNQPSFEAVLSAQQSLI